MMKSEFFLYIDVSENFYISLLVEALYVYIIPTLKVSPFNTI